MKPLFPHAYFYPTEIKLRCGKHPSELEGHEYLFPTQRYKCFDEVHRLVSMGMHNSSISFPGAHPGDAAALNQVAGGTFKPSLAPRAPLPPAHGPCRLPSPSSPGSPTHCLGFIHLVTLGTGGGPGQLSCFSSTASPPKGPLDHPFSRMFWLLLHPRRPPTSDAGRMDLVPLG